MTSQLTSFINGYPSVIEIDLFWITREIDFAIYAEHNTPYASGYSIDDVIKSLDDDSINLFKWFQDNQM